MSDFHRATTYGGLLPRAASRPLSTTGLPQFRWPSERHLTPTNCAHCGARLLRGDIPTASYPTADVVCQLCSRTACELVLDGYGARPIPQTTCACGRPAAPLESECRPCGKARKAREYIARWRARQEQPADQHAAQLEARRLRYRERAGVTTCQ